MTTRLNRRQTLGAMAALPVSAGLLATARPAAAVPERAGPATAPFHRIRLGGFDVTTLLAGTRTVPDLQTIFGLNVGAEDFAAAAEAAMIPADRSQFFFTPTVVNTGSDLVLFDTGLNPEGITAALGAAGYAPGDVTAVVITHMHGDHIGGLMGETGPTFPNARYFAGAEEFDHWTMSGNELFGRNVEPLAEQMTMLDDGDSPVSGVTAMASFGHTPGHMAFMLESEGQSLLLIGDITNHYVFSLAHPDWEVRFDMDKAAAAATRRRVLGMLAAERMPFVGYHMPFPGIGYVAAAGDGFRYVPHSYQLMMDTG
ncbi:MAG: MBL fold metallo-hydrolase [Gemmobacter sp.]